MSDRGAASMLLPALIALTFVLLTAAGGAALLISARWRAQTAADAAALAAAPVTFRPFGSNLGPAGEASAYARAHGAELVTCACAIDRTFDTRQVTVEVVIRTWVPILRDVEVPASATAEFRPIVLLGELVGSP